MSSTIIMRYAFKSESSFSGVLRCPGLGGVKDGKIDAILERGDLSQREYFYKIVDINSRESQALMFD